MELGQLLHGNPTVNYSTPEYVDALVLYMLDEIGRIYWNKNQVEWGRYEDPEMKNVEFRPYYWGDDDTESAKPNLKFSNSDIEIRWYKHPGRSMSASHDLSPEEWVAWFNKGMKIIRQNE